MANSPVVLIAGVVGLKAYEKLDLQDMRQLPVIEPLVKKALVCQITERIPEFIDMAYRIAISGCPGPVYLELPVDVWNGQVDEKTVKRTNTLAESRGVDLEKTRILLEMLEAAEKPIFIAGSGAYYSRAEKEFAAFIEKTGVPGFTSATGRGLLPDTHPLCFEASSAIRPGAAADALMGADLIVFLGNRISLYYAFGDLLNPNAKLVQVGIRQEEIGRNRTIHLGIFSDIKALLKEVNHTGGGLTVFKTSLPEGYLFSKGYTNYIFILLWLLYFFDYVDRMVVVSLFPFLRTEWGLNDVQCGALVSAVYWAIVIFSFPVSIVIDRWSRKKSIGIMAVLWIGATAACALTRNFGQLFVARTAIGLGEAGYAPGGTAMISALYPEKKRALMVGIWNSSIPIGMAAGIVLGGVIATHWGWRTGG